MKTLIQLMCAMVLLLGCSKTEQRGSLVQLSEKARKVVNEADYVCYLVRAGSGTNSEWRVKEIWRANTNAEPPLGKHNFHLWLQTFGTNGPAEAIFWHIPTQGGSACPVNSGRIRLLDGQDITTEQLKAVVLERGKVEPLAPGNAVLRLPVYPGSAARRA
jgi:hypothetical protein